MKMKAQNSIILKRNFKKMMSILLPIAKKVISNQVNQIKSYIMRKIQPNKRQNTLKRVSNRRIKSLENIINTPKIAIEKPKVVTASKIATKPKIVIEKKPNYDELKNRVMKQLKKHLKKLSDAKKRYLDEEYKGIRDLEHLFEEINENDED